MSDPGTEWSVFRAIQLHNFNSPMLLDDDQDLLTALRNVPGIDAEQVVARIDAPDVVEAYRADREETRTAEGSAAELQGKTATSDGPVRFTAPSVVFESNGTRLVAGGFQPVEAYDVLVANIDPKLHREPAPEEPAPLLERFPDGLTTQEVAALLAQGNDKPDRAAAEVALLELLGAGAAVRDPLGDDALWRSAVYADRPAMVPGRRGRRLRRLARPPGAVLGAPEVSGNKRCCIKLGGCEVHTTTRRGMATVGTIRGKAGRETCPCVGTFLDQALPRWSTPCELATTNRRAPGFVHQPLVPGFLRRRRRD